MRLIYAFQTLSLAQAHIPRPEGGGGGPDNRPLCGSQEREYLEGLRHTPQCSGGGEERGEEVSPHSAVGASLGASTWSCGVCVCSEMSHGFKNLSLENNTAILLETPEPSGILLETPVTPGVLLEAPVTSGKLLETPEPSGILLETPVTSGILLETPVTSGILLEPPVTSGILLETPVTSGILSHVWISR